MVPVMVVHTYNPSYLGGRGRRILSLRPVWAKLARPHLKNKIKDKRAGDIDQVVECGWVQQPVLQKLLLIKILCMNLFHHPLLPIRNFIMASILLLL
jgi:hypothetical protein